MPLLCNPFINDYVKVNSRGSANGIQNMGMTMGNLVSVAVVFSITKNMENKFWSFGFMATLQLLWCIPSYFMIQEPEIYNPKEEKRKNKKSVCGQIKSIIKQTYKACKEDHALAIGLFGLSISRNGTMLQQVQFQNWIASYED